MTLSFIILTKTCEGFNGDARIAAISARTFDRRYGNRIDLDQPACRSGIEGVARSPDDRKVAILASAHGDDARQAARGFPAGGRPGRSKTITSS
jgi:hypothetical protein